MTYVSYVMLCRVILYSYVMLCIYIYIHTVYMHITLDAAAHCCPSGHEFAEPFRLHHLRYPQVDCTAELCWRSKEISHGGSLTTKVHLKMLIYEGDYILLISLRLKSG